MGLGDSLGNRKPQSAAASFRPSGSVCPNKSLEDVLSEMGRNPDPVVGKVNDRLTVLDFQLDFHRCSGLYRMALRLGSE